MRVIVCVQAAIAGIVVCSTAFADCDMRDATPAELQYKARVAAALKAALPAAPAKWTMTAREEDPGAFSLCASEPIGEFEVRVIGKYVHRRTKEESDRIYAERRKVEKEIDALRQLPPAVKKEQQGWLDKMSVANRASNAAYKQGDKALARQKSDEADGYSAKGREVRDRYWASVQPQVDQLEARARTMNSGDVNVIVRIAANESDAKTPKPEVARQFTAGKVPAPHPGLKVRGVRLLVEGSATERGDIEAAVDPEKLKRLVQ